MGKKNQTRVYDIRKSQPAKPPEPVATNPVPVPPTDEDLKKPFDRDHSFPDYPKPLPDAGHVFEQQAPPELIKKPRALVELTSSQKQKVRVNPLNVCTLRTYSQVFTGTPQGFVRIHTADGNFLDVEGTFDEIEAQLFPANE